VDRLSHSYYGDYVQRGHLKWHAVAPDHELVTGIIKAPNRNMRNDNVILHIVGAPGSNKLAPDGQYSFLRRTGSKSLVIAEEMAELRSSVAVMLKKVTVASLTSHEDDRKWRKDVDSIKKPCKFNGKVMAGDDSKVDAVTTTTVQYV